MMIQRKYLLVTKPDIVLLKPYGYQQFNIEQGCIETSKGVLWLHYKESEDRFFVNHKTAEGEKTSTEISKENYDFLNQFVSRRLDKVRYVFTYQERLFELDFFPHGMVVARVYVTEEEKVEFPEWLEKIVMREVTEDEYFSGFKSSVPVCS